MPYGLRCFRVPCHDPCNSRMFSGRAFSGCWAICQRSETCQLQRSSTARPKCLGLSMTAVLRLLAGTWEFSIAAEDGHGRIANQYSFDASNEIFSAVVGNTEGVAQGGSVDAKVIEPELEQVCLSCAGLQVAAGDMGQ